MKIYRESDLVRAKLDELDNFAKVILEITKEDAATDPEGKLNAVIAFVAIRGMLTQAKLNMTLAGETVNKTDETKEN